MTSRVSARAATVADAGAIAKVHVQAWRETYVGLLPDVTLAGLSVGQRADVWKDLTNTAKIWVVEDECTIVGWASTGSGRDADNIRPIELEGIYVVASHHGTGAGQVLLNASIGKEPAYLWVAAENRRARAFYQRNGFLADLNSTAAFAGTPIDVVRMVR